MGTHPIFESDFDCLTDLMKSIFLIFSAALSQTVTIQGRLQPTPYEAPQFKGLEVYLDNGLAGFVQENGQFAVHHVPVGTTFILKVKSPRLTYPSLRIDVNAAGKIRARKLNILTLKDVDLVDYPLQLMPLGATPYFQKREQFSIFDTLKSPMVLFMLLPMVILFLLPKLMDMQDPELKKEMEEQMKTMNKNNVPDMSELMSSLFGGDKPKKIAPKKKKN